MPKTQVQVHVKPNNEYYGTVKLIEVERITGNELPIPVQDGTLIYSGGSQSPSWIGYDPDKMTVSGIYGTNAGTYYAKFKLKDFQEWEDGTIKPKTVAWIIDKAPGYGNFNIQQVDNSSYTFNHLYLNEQKNIQIVSASGAVTVSGYSSSDVEISVDGNVIHVTPLKLFTNTNLTFQVNVGASTNYNAVSYTFYGTVIEHDDIIYGVKYGPGIEHTTYAKYDMFNRTEGAKAFGLYSRITPGTATKEGSSPFDNLFPWNKMEIVFHPLAGYLVKIPKFYVRYLVDDSNFEIQICKKKLDGFQVSPAHADRHDGNGERNWVYVGRYYSAPNGDFKSMPNVNINQGTWKKGFDFIHNSIRNLGKDIYLFDISMYWTLISLFLVENGSAYNYGIARNTSTTTGFSDSYPYHTDSGQYRNIESYSARSGTIDGLYCDNIYTDSTKYHIEKKKLCVVEGLNFDSIKSVNGIYVGDVPLQGNYYVKKWKNTNNQLCPLIPEIYCDANLNEISTLGFYKPVGSNFSDRDTFKEYSGVWYGSSSYDYTEIFIWGRDFLYGDNSTLYRNRLMYLPSNNEVDENGDFILNTAKLPTITNTSFVYNTKEQGPTYTYNSNAMTVSGDTKATNAGTYQLVFSLKQGFSWPDGTVADKTYSWTIAKTTMSINKTNVTYSAVYGVNKTFKDIIISNCSFTEGNSYPDVKPSFSDNNITNNIGINGYASMYNNDPQQFVFIIGLKGDEYHNSGTVTLTLEDHGDANHNPKTVQCRITVNGNAPA